MSDFGQSFMRFFTELKGLSDDDPYWLAVFLCACGAMGALAVAMDWSHFLIRGSSLMNVAHGAKTTPVILFGWVLGAIIGGFFGQVLNILQTTILASLTAGIGWPLILTKAIEQASKADAEKPEVIQT